MRRDERAGHELVLESSVMSVSRVKAQISRSTNLLGSLAKTLGFFAHVGARFEDLVFSSWQGLKIAEDQPESAGAARRAPGRGAYIQVLRHAAMSSTRSATSSSATAFSPATLARGGESVRALERLGPGSPGMGSDPGARRQRLRSDADLGRVAAFEILIWPIQPWLLYLSGS